MNINRKPIYSFKEVLHLITLSENMEDLKTLDEVVIAHKHRYSLEELRLFKSFVTMKAKLIIMLKQK